MNPNQTLPPSFLRRSDTLQGAHYKVVPGEEHHERAIRLNLNWYAGNITKYAERAPHKGQLTEDLIKVLDYTCMWLKAQQLSTDQFLRIQAAVGRLEAPPKVPTPVIRLQDDMPKVVPKSEWRDRGEVLGAADGNYINQDGGSTRNSPHG